jgi:hypothetical protein
VSSWTDHFPSSDIVSCAFTDRAPSVEIQHISIVNNRVIANELFLFF